MSQINISPFSFDKLLDYDLPGLFVYILIFIFITGCSFLLKWGYNKMHFDEKMKRIEILSEEQKLKSQTQKDSNEKDALETYSILTAKNFENTLAVAKTTGETIAKSVGDKLDDAIGRLSDNLSLALTEASKVNSLSNKEIIIALGESQKYIIDHQNKRFDDIIIVQAKILENARSKTIN